MEKFTVSNTPGVFEGWPDLVKTKTDRLICTYTECSSHQERKNTRLVYRISDDRGRTWCDSRYLTDPISPEETNPVYNNTSVSLLSDGRIALLFDMFHAHGAGKHGVYMMFSEDNGETFGNIIETPVIGMVPDKLLELKCGRWIITAHINEHISSEKDNNVWVSDEGDNKLVQNLWYSDDKGKTWSESITVGKDKRYNLCEGSILETSDETLVAFMRENSGKGIGALKAISYNHGESWEGVYETPLQGAHKPVAGKVGDDLIMVTYRYLPSGCMSMKAINSNLFAGFLFENELKNTEYSKQGIRVFPIDYDRSSESDTGYSGWVKFNDGEIYVVNYLVDDKQYKGLPQAQIRGYCFSLKDIFIDYEESTKKLGM